MMMSAIVAERSQGEGRGLLPCLVKARASRKYMLFIMNEELRPEAFRAYSPDSINIIKTMQ